MTILTEEVPVVARKSQPWDSFHADSKIPHGQTDELLTWLSKVNQKKQSIRSTRHRDFRKEALLESARLSAQAQLERKQRERMLKWKMVKSSMNPPSPVSEVDDNLCDCDSCVLCQRHRSTMYGKCYCNVIFSPRPVFMDFNTPVSATDAFSDDEDSIQVDNFLASLSLKRRSDAEEDSLASRKRAKA
jgi:hypothetical protein